MEQLIDRLVKAPLGAKIGVVANTMIAAANKTTA
jgi:hypothetical protein